MVKMTDSPDNPHTRAIHSAFVALVVAIGRGDTAMAASLGDLLVEVVRDRVAIDAELRSRVEAICD